ncbi:MAG: antibiotic biosynthesis monooxygenase [Flavobacteriales bacterium]|nr:antibiotic biosynthesis monooxygenase [Flavobacteriales bacterium]
MLTRIVKMTFREDKLEDFRRIFEHSIDKIRSFEGCTHVELNRDTHRKNVYFTYSKWTSEEMLNAYRNSGMFRSTWSEVKKLFAEPPEAHSLYTVHSSEEKVKV